MGGLIPAHLKITNIFLLFLWGVQLVVASYKTWLRQKLRYRLAEAIKDRHTAAVLHGF